MAKTIRESDTRPTQFDSPWGNLLDEDRQDWLIVPVGRTRDSDVLDESNFEAALRELGGESETVEVHRFGHWGPGWFEVLIADPCHESIVDDIEAALENYPVLDETDYSERELEASYENWFSYGANNFRDEIKDLLGVDYNKHPILDDAIDNYDIDGLYELFTELEGEVEYNGSDTNFRIDLYEDERSKIVAAIKKQWRAERKR